MLANTWTTIFLFIICASLLNLSIAFLIKKETLPIALTIDYSQAQFKFIKIWVKFALIIGIIFPLILLAIDFSNPIYRQIWGLYLLAIVFQLISERLLNRLFFKSIVAIVGTIYTTFRIWQLWEALNLLDYHQPWLALLWIILAFWVANIIMLITVPWPIIIKGDRNLTTE
ncbi:MAG: hypothetical protein ACFBSE_03360 [Prochloraceae cyanobacterium]